jgi:hypothetical protein
MPVLTVNKESAPELFAALALIIKRGYALEASDHALAIDALTKAITPPNCIGVPPNDPLPCGCRLSDVLLCTHGNSPLA